MEKTCLNSEEKVPQNLPQQVTHKNSGRKGTVISSRPTILGNKIYSIAFQEGNKIEISNWVHEDNLNFL